MSTDAPEVPSTAEAISMTAERAKQMNQALLRAALVLDAIQYAVPPEDRREWQCRVAEAAVGLYGHSIWLMEQMGYRRQPDEGDLDLSDTFADPLDD